MPSQKFQSVAWGFTTQNFLEFIPPSLAAARSFLSEARLLGLQWLELRDPDAVLSLEECQELAAYANSLGLEVNYSAQRGLLAADLEPVLKRSVANTACFQGPRAVRLLGLRGRGEKGWSEDEFNRVLDQARRAAKLSAKQGVRLSIENADVALFGKPGAYFGMDDLFDQLDGSIGWQLDTANLFLGPVAVSSSEAAVFIRRFAARVTYLHVKTACLGVALPTLAENPLDFSSVFRLLENHERVYAAIELASDKSVEAIRVNLQNSLQYLNGKGLRAG